jgi:hypothetical protein
MTATVTFAGAVNQPNAGSERAKYLKLFTGEVYEAFRNSLIFKPLVMNRTLRDGREAQFIHTGRMTSAYHVPGTPILGQGQPPVAETTITVDDLLTSSAFLYDLDEVLRHYEVRGPISRQIGQALAERYDRNVGRTLFRASGLAAAVTGEPGGFRINLGAGNVYNAQAIVDGFFEAAARLDEVSAPKEGRVCVLSPRQYYALISQVDTNILNRDYGNSQGNMNSGEGLYSIAGISIRQSNNVPIQGGFGRPATGSEAWRIGAPVTGTGRGNEGVFVPGERNNYGAQADFNNAAGLVFHREAAGVVESIGPSVETTGHDTKVIYQGEVIVGKLAMGTAPVRTVVAGAFTAAP